MPRLPIANGDKHIKPRVKRASANATLGVMANALSSLKVTNKRPEMLLPFRELDQPPLLPRVPFALAHSTLGFRGLSPLATRNAEHLGSDHTKPFNLITQCPNYTPA